MACRILLVSGSLRRGSTNGAALLTARELMPEGVDGVMYERLGRLPHFNADNDTDSPPDEVARLRTAIHSAAALVFSTPEYAGALPGSFKNLLDWTIGDGQPGSIYEKPVAWINSSPRGAAGAHDELRNVLGYAHAVIVETACLRVPITQAMIGPDGLVHDVSARDGIARVVSAAASYVDCATAPAMPSV